MGKNGFNLEIGLTYNTKNIERELGDLTKRIETSVTTATDEKLKKHLDTYVRTVETADGHVRKYTKTLLSYKNSMGQTTDATGKLIGENKALLKSQNFVSKAIKQSKDSADEATTSFNHFVETAIKVAQIKVTSTLLSTFSTACSEAKQAVIDLDDAITEFNKVSDLSKTGDLQGYIDSLAKMGEGVARSRADMLNGSTQFVKSGYSENDAAQLARINALLQNVADSELSAEEGANILISTMKGFNLVANDAEHVVDAINEVELFVTSLNRVNCGENPMMFVSYNVI